MAGKANSEDSNLLIQSCLPLRLQDLCLLRVINDLDAYPVDLLASLPRWLRYRLLNNLPVLDLCRLERSAIARDIDPAELWRSRWQISRIPQSFYLPPLSNSIRSDFHYRIKDAEFLQYLEPELLAAFQQLSKKDTLDAKQLYLLQVASDVLDSIKTDSMEIDTDVQPLPIVPSDWLISMKGDRLLQDLTEATHNLHQARFNIRLNKAATDSYKMIWESQGTALSRYEQDDVRLAPHRLLSIRERNDPIELLGLLIHECGLQPLTIANLGLPRMTNSKQWKQCIETKEKFTSILRHILSQVSVLGIQCDHVSQAQSVVQTILDAILTGEEQCRLRYLYSREVTIDFMSTLSPHFYVLPDSTSTHSPPPTPRYQGLSVIQLGVSDLDSTLHLSAMFEQQPQLKCVQVGFDCGRGDIEPHPDAIHLFSSLSSLFSRPQFRFLKLELKSECTISPRLLQELLSGFMKAPCDSNKQLTITSESSDPSLVHQKEVDLAAVDLSLIASSGSSVVPDSGLQYKNLNLSPNLQSVVGNLLRLSTIRIKNIHFDCSHDSYPYLHQAAMHPDLQVTSFSVQFQLCPFDKLLTNVENDLVTFFKKPALREVNLYGYWRRFVEIKAAIVEALRQRSKIGPLTKIMLTCPPRSREVGKQSGDEFPELWKAIFSLPGLDQLELVVRGDMTNVIMNNEESINEIWKEASSSQTRIKLLKVMQYMGAEDAKDHPMLCAITQTLQFASRPFQDRRAKVKNWEWPGDQAM